MDALSKYFDKEVAAQMLMSMLKLATRKVMKNGSAEDIGYDSLSDSDEWDSEEASMMDAFSLYPFSIFFEFLKLGSFIIEIVLVTAIIILVRVHAYADILGRRVTAILSLVAGIGAIHIVEIALLFVTVTIIPAGFIVGLVIWPLLGFVFILGMLNIVVLGTLEILSIVVSFAVSILMATTGVVITIAFFRNRWPNNGRPHHFAVTRTEFSVTTLVSIALFGLFIVCILVPLVEAIALWTILTIAGVIGVVVMIAAPIGFSTASSRTPRDKMALGVAIMTAFHSIAGLLFGAIIAACGIVDVYTLVTNTDIDASHLIALGPLRIMMYGSNQTMQMAYAAFMGIMMIVMHHTLAKKEPEYMDPACLDENIDGGVDPLGDGEENVQVVDGDYYV